MNKTTQPAEEKDHNRSRIILSHRSNEMKMRRQERKRSRPPSPEKELQGSNLNISAGRVFYENARSRRERHRVVLMSSNQSSDAIPLGKSGKRGPGRTSDLPGDIARAKAKGETDEDGANKVRELIDAGRSMAAKSRSSSRSLNPCKTFVTPRPTSAHYTNSRMRISKNTQSLQSNSSKKSSRQIKAQSKSNGPETPREDRRAKGKNAASLWKS